MAEEKPKKYSSLNLATFGRPSVKPVAANSRLTLKTAGGGSFGQMVVLGGDRSSAHVRNAAPMSDPTPLVAVGSARPPDEAARRQAAALATSTRDAVAASSAPPLATTSTSTSGGTGNNVGTANQQLFPAPLPINLPSLRAENAGVDPSVALVPAGGSGWATEEQSNTASSQDADAAPVAAAAPAPAPASKIPWADVEVESDDDDEHVDVGRHGGYGDGCAPDAEATPTPVRLFGQRAPPGPTRHSDHRRDYPANDEDQLASDGRDGRSAHALNARSPTKKVDFVDYRRRPVGPGPVGPRDAGELVASSRAISIMPRTRPGPLSAPLNVPTIDVTGEQRTLDDSVQPPRVAASHHARDHGGVYARAPIVTILQRPAGAKRQLYDPKSNRFVDPPAVAPGTKRVVQKQDIGTGRAANRKGNARNTQKDKGAGGSAKAGQRVKNGSVGEKQKSGKPRQELPGKEKPAAAEAKSNKQRKDLEGKQQRNMDGKQQKNIKQYGNTGKQQKHAKQQGKATGPPKQNASGSQQEKTTGSHQVSSKPQQSQKARPVRQDAGNASLQQHRKGTAREQPGSGNAKARQQQAGRLSDKRTLPLDARIVSPQEHGDHRPQDKLGGVGDQRHHHLANNHDQVQDGQLLAEPLESRGPSEHDGQAEPSAMNLPPPPPTMTSFHQASVWRDAAHDKVAPLSASLSSKTDGGMMGAPGATTVVAPSFSNTSFQQHAETSHAHLLNTAEDPPPQHSSFPSQFPHFHEQGLYAAAAPTWSDTAADQQQRAVHAAAMAAATAAAPWLPPELIAAAAAAATAATTPTMQWNAPVRSVAELTAMATSAADQAISASSSQDLNEERKG